MESALLDHPRYRPETPPPQPRPIAEMTGPWFLVGFQNNLIFSAARRLLSEGLNYFIPLDHTPVMRVESGRNVQRYIVRPLFPSWFFVIGPDAQECVWSLSGRYAVDRVVQDSKLKNEMQSIEIAMNGKAHLAIGELAHGQTVRVVYRPQSPMAALSRAFEGITGVVRGIDDVKSVVCINVEMTGKAAELTIDSDCLEPV